MEQRKTATKRGLLPPYPLGRVTLVPSEYLVSHSFLVLIAIGFKDLLNCDVKGLESKWVIAEAQTATNLLQLLHGRLICLTPTIEVWSVSVAVFGTGARAGRFLL